MEPTAGSWARGVIVFAIMLCSSSAAHAQAGTAPSASRGAGTLVVEFLYMPPTSVEPTYHTAMWLEDAKGKLVRTLYVSQELSSAEYKLGNACPDWVKQAHWEKAAKSEVDGVTAPTPNVGSEAKVFDLGQLGVPPGVYQFKFQVHITEQYNVLYRGEVTVGPADSTPKLDVLYGPGKLDVTDQFVREVRVRYVAPSK